MTNELTKVFGFLPVLAGLLAAWGGVELWERVQCYRRLRREREQLVALSDRELGDIGISRTDALREAGRPLWRGCLSLER
jgi:uncharacterized protein YjiS (DUF1127 family)